MLLELNQLYYDEGADHWYTQPIAIKSEFVQSIYIRPDCGVTSLILSSGVEVMVNENYKDILRMIRPECRNQFKWISCEDMEPVDDGEYLVTTNKLSYSVQFMQFKRGRWRTQGKERVVAWMSVPKPYWLAAKNSYYN